MALSLRNVLARGGEVGAEGRQVGGRSRGLHCPVLIKLCTRIRVEQNPVCQKFDCLFDNCLFVCLKNGEQNFGSSGYKDFLWSMNGTSSPRRDRHSSSHFSYQTYRKTYIHTDIRTKGQSSRSCGGENLQLDIQELFSAPIFLRLQITLFILQMSVCPYVHMYDMTYTLLAGLRPSFDSMVWLCSLK